MKHIRLPIDWKQGIPQRLQKCSSSAEIRIEQTCQQNADKDVDWWKAWWNVELKRQENCERKAIYFYP